MLGLLLIGLSAMAGEGAEARAARWLGDYAFPAEPSPVRGVRDGSPLDLSSPPVPTWSVDLPGPPLNAATHTERTRPVVIGDRILVGSAAGKGLYALSLENGALLHTYPANASVESEPLVVDDRVYFADTSGTTWCYDLDGEVVWSHRSNAPILTQPTLADGRIYITNVDDLALAIDAETGEQVWRFKSKRDLLRLAELALYAAPPATIVDDLVVFGFSSGELVALETSTGDVRWKLQVGEGRYPDVVAEPVAAGGDLLASGYFQPLVAIDKKAQAVRWRADAGAAFPVLVENGVVFHPGSDGVLRAYSLLTGAEKWSWSSETGTALTTPVATRAGLFVGASAGSLYLIDPETGRERWAYREPLLLQGLTSTPVAVGDQLLFVTNAGRLHAMRATHTRRRPLQHRIFGRED